MLKEEVCQKTINIKKGQTISLLEKPLIGTEDTGYSILSLPEFNKRFDGYIQIEVNNTQYYIDENGVANNGIPLDLLSETPHLISYIHINEGKNFNIILKADQTEENIRYTFKYIKYTGKDIKLLNEFIISGLNPSPQMIHGMQMRMVKKEIMKKFNLPENII